MISEQENEGSIPKETWAFLTSPGFFGKKVLWYLIFAIHPPFLKETLVKKKRNGMKIFFGGEVYTMHLPWHFHC